MARHPGRTRAHTLIWTAGTAPATQMLDGGHLPRGKRKHLVVDRHLRVKGHENIYAAGDWTYRLIYLLKLVGTRNKLQALASLTFNRIFEPTV